MRVRCVPCLATKSDAVRVRYVQGLATKSAPGGAVGAAFGEQIKCCKSAACAAFDDTTKFGCECVACAAFGDQLRCCENAML